MLATCYASNVLNPASNVLKPQTKNRLKHVNNMLINNVLNHVNMLSRLIHVRNMLAMC